MGYKTLELTVISAKDLKNVNLIGKMDVYVVVSLSDEPKNKQKTPVHQDGGTNPSWNYTIRFTIDEDAAAKPGKYLIFQLKHQHTFGADKDLGEVMVPLKELFGTPLKGSDPTAPQFVTYQVRRSSGKAKGELKFSYKLIDMGQSYQPAAQSCSSSSSSSYPPPVGYPPPQQQGVYPPPQQQGGYPPPQQQGGGYPPPQQQGGYPPPMAVPYAGPQGYPPPQPAYGAYPPPAPGYGYPPPGGYPPVGYPPAQAQKPQKPKKNNFGMGLGAGLLGGAVGGLVLGEMVDDAFDVDFGGFDF